MVFYVVYTVLYQTIPYLLKSKPSCHIVLYYTLHRLYKSLYKDLQLINFTTNPCLAVQREFWPVYVAVPDSTSNVSSVLADQLKTRSIYGRAIVNAIETSDNAPRTWWGQKVSNSHSSLHVNLFRSMTFYG